MRVNKYLARATKHRGVLVILITLFLLTSCARLPEYARPKFNVSSNPGEINQSGFNYRTLEVGDFEAVSLDSDAQPYSRNIRARSCITIRPDNSTRATVSPKTLAGNRLYTGYFTTIRFEAIFIPACSWWNPSVPEEMTSYVLQHEQIHFAISKLTAARVTGEMSAFIEGYTAIGGTGDEVKEALVQSVLDLANTIIESDLHIHTDFDEQTSMFYDPDEQTLWFERIEQQLADTTGRPDLQGYEQSED